MPTGRTDFIGGLDNEALDFGHLDLFLQGTGTNTHTESCQSNISSAIIATPSALLGQYQTQSVPSQTNNGQQQNLPDSPPNSSSEPPYSPKQIYSLLDDKTLQMGHLPSYDHLLADPNNGNNLGQTNHGLQQRLDTIDYSDLLYVPHPSVAPKKRKTDEPKMEPKQSSPDLCQLSLDKSDINFEELHQLIDPDNTSLSSGQQMQCIRFSHFQQRNWHTLCDQHFRELQIPHYRVDADKGFNFSTSDDAFVCQKKNHFQITCHAQLQGTNVSTDTIFVRTVTGIEKVKAFYLHFYGVKLEAPGQIIRVEQSQSDRSKKPFHPVAIDLSGNQLNKITVGRLHFSETTSNNMRKKGRPNPEQRYFQLVVALHAHTHSGNYPIISYASERIIVRASNPGQFESDIELSWQRGMTVDSIYHAGRVGINTDRPDECLVVNGNIKLTGHIIQPSDRRAKSGIYELDPAKQLENVKKIRVVNYCYAAPPNMQPSMDTGVIAQEIREILPEAVKESGTIQLANGEMIDNFLVVNKERLFMENIGAVKELSKITGNLESRVTHLERVNLHLLKRQENMMNGKGGKTKILTDTESGLCSNRFIHCTIIGLIAIMAICLMTIAALYFAEHQRLTPSSSVQYFVNQQQTKQLNGNGNKINDYDLTKESAPTYKPLGNQTLTNRTEKSAGLLPLKRKRVQATLIPPTKSSVLYGESLKQKHDKTPEQPEEVDTNVIEGATGSAQDILLKLKQTDMNLAY